MIQDVCSSLLDLLLPFRAVSRSRCGWEVWPRRLPTKEITYVKDARFVRNRTKDELKLAPAYNNTGSPSEDRDQGGDIR